MDGTLPHHPPPAHPHIPFIVNIAALGETDEGTGQDMTFAADCTHAGASHKPFHPNIKQANKQTHIASRLD